MTIPTLFIGSSTEGLFVARAVRDHLNGGKFVTADLWDEDVFKSGNFFLEDLLKCCEKYDLAVIVFTPDEKVTSRGQEAMSPRDNLVFEAGLFISKIGRDRTFILTARDLEKPSDLEGVTLLHYDFAQAKADPAAAVEQACQQIVKAVNQLNFRHLTGVWYSRYRYPYRDDHPLVQEEVEVLASYDQLKISSRENPLKDHYLALGRRMMGQHFVGQWESIDEEGTSLRTGGAFVLTMHPKNKLLYGFFVSPDAHGGVTHGSWVLVKKEGGPSVQTDASFTEGIKLLDEANRHCQMSLGQPDPPPPRQDGKKRILTGLFRRKTP